MSKILKGIGPDLLAGMRIVRIKAVIEYTLPWYERLFSWPWRPWRKKIFVENPSLPPRGQWYQNGNSIYMRESEAHLLMSQLNKL